MIAYSLNHGGHARIPYPKAFAGSAGSEKLSACRTVQASVADDRIFVRDLFPFAGWFDDNFTA